jgi:exopolyphosphatase/pppGpp-phosphohydrolase
MDRQTIARPTPDLSAFALTEPLHISLEAWTRRRLGKTDHERRVAQIAAALFDLTQDLHNLSRRSRSILVAAALIHDVGRSEGADDHATVGAQMIFDDPRLSLTPSQRRALAYLSQHHRGQVPELGEDDILSDDDNREELLKILGLLRASDTLDSRSIEAPRLLLVRRHRGIQIRCFLRHPDDRARKAFCRPKKYRLLEATLNCTVELDVQDGDAEMLLG